MTTAAIKRANSLLDELARAIAETETEITQVEAVIELNRLLQKAQHNVRRRQSALAAEATA